MKIRTEKTIEVAEWDKLVQDTYGRPYSFQQQDGCKSRGIYRFVVPDEADDYFGNDTVPEIVNGNEMGVSFKAWLERNPSQNLPNISKGCEDFSLKLWWERNFYPDHQMVANDLYKKGLLEADEYIIEIDW